MFVQEGASRTNMTSTTTLTLATNLIGIFVASASSTPTIKVADSLGTIANTFTPTGAQYYPMPTSVDTCVVTISGTVDCTAFWS